MSPKRLIFSTFLTFAVLIGGPLKPAEAVTIEFLSIDPPAPTEVIVDEEVRFTASYDGNVEPTDCDLYLDGSTYNMNIDTSASTLSTNAMWFSGTNTFTNTYISCSASGNDYESDPVTVEVVEEATEPPIIDAPSGGIDVADAQAPEVGAFPVTSAVVGSNMTLSVSVSDNVAVTECTLSVDGVLIDSMSVADDHATLDYVFTVSGAHTAQVSCEDAHHNQGENALTTITATDVPSTGLLVKLECPDTVYVNDPCTAVYFYGSDGYRHAFPNEKVYFTWYADYDDVLTVSASYMAALPLGANVTYRPGYKMVKFVTDATVYAVSQGGELRALASESVAEDLYGSAWNKQIDDISDVFYSSYHFGSDINTSADYDPAAELAMATSINGNW